MSAKHDEMTPDIDDILSQHSGILHKVSKAYCPQEAEREDLMQEMMIQIWRSLPRYDPQYRLSTWIYRIALNVAISHYRRSSSAQHVALHEEMGEEDSTPAVHAQIDQLYAFIYELKPLDRALALLYLEEKSHKEIAEILGISPSNVATRIGRIKQQLKKKFEALHKQS